MVTYRVLSDYIYYAMKQAEITRLSDFSFAGKISVCKGVVALEKSIPECREALQAALESWIILGLKTNHALPIVHGINLNKEPFYESEYSL